MSAVAATLSVQTGLPSAGMVPMSEAMLSRVLEPYSYKGCRYLNDAEYGITSDAVHAQGNFAIDESAYIRSTGHFNAVELVLCFNQLAYCAFAQGVVNDDIWAFRGWSIDDYCENQLASMLIKSTSSRFRRLVNPRQFSARLQARDFHIVDCSWRYLQFHSTIEFWDQDGGSAAGEFDIAVLNIP
ncbi:FcoT family thioesterase [Mycobacteroides abscessus]|uniref:FcoT family thioesterase n=1 Tax=Mycobacteroides abscessus TaxID=36809 RepID=UPI0009A903DC|nr:FcoT family thioesterase [Mycobacteroides abscessus]SLC90481.1 Probable fatty acyl CoA thioesterase type III FcoT [Mycobacteroides abscessus subsp. massiliense]